MRNRSFYCFLIVCLCWSVWGVKPAIAHTTENDMLTIVLKKTPLSGDSVVKQVEKVVVQGVVKDSHGGVLPGVTVVVKVRIMDFQRIIMDNSILNSLRGKILLWSFLLSE